MRSLQLRDLLGRAIEDIGTVRLDADGDDMVYLYLSDGVTIGADLAALEVCTRRRYNDIWVDFTRHLENDSPFAEKPWDESSGQGCLLLSQLVGLTIWSIGTTHQDGQWSIYIKINDDLYLLVAERDLVADGEYDEVWPDAPALQQPMDAVTGTRYQARAALS